MINRHDKASGTNRHMARYPHFAALILLAVSCNLWLTGCDNKQPVQTISLGAPQSMLPSLIWLSDELGFFKEQGIELKLRAYPSGKRALEAMMEGKEELAATAETPFVIACFERDDLRLYATMGQSDSEVLILSRRDHGINQPSDLENKTIATQQGSALHYFLTSFMLYHQFDPENSKISFMKVEDLHLALARGDVDAIAIREPFLSKAKSLIDHDKLSEFTAPGLYTKTYNLVGSSDFTTKHPGAMAKILSALSKGATYADNYPQKAIDIITEKLNLSREQVVSLWPQVRLSITLNQGLLSTLQEEALWVTDIGLIKTNKYKNESIPDFLKYIDPSPLRQAIPYAVGLIGIRQME